MRSPQKSESFFSFFSSINIQTNLFITLFALSFQKGLLFQNLVTTFTSQGILGSIFLNCSNELSHYAVHFLIKMRAEGQTTLNTKQMLFIMIIQNMIQMIGKEKIPVKTRLPHTIFCWIIPHWSRLCDLLYTRFIPQKVHTQFMTPSNKRVIPEKEITNLLLNLFSIRNSPLF